MMLTGSDKHSNWYWFSFFIRPENKRNNPFCCCTGTKVSTAIIRDDNADNGANVNAS